MISAIGCLQAVYRFICCVPSEEEEAAKRVCGELSRSFTVAGRKDNYYRNLDSAVKAYVALGHMMKVEALGMHKDVVEDFCLLVDLHQGLKGDKKGLEGLAYKALDRKIPLFIVDNIVGEFVDLEPKFAHYMAVVKEEKECTQCIEPITATDCKDKRVLRVDCCRNYFHTDCGISEWLKAKKECSICKLPVDYDRTTKRWAGYLERIHHRVLIEFGFKEEAEALDRAYAIRLHFQELGHLDHLDR